MHYGSKSGMTIDQAETKDNTWHMLLMEVRPTWESLEFDCGLPELNLDTERPAPSYIYGTIMDNRIVYRVFTSEDKTASELCRYVFFKDTVVKESRDHIWEIVPASILTEVNSKDILKQTGAHSCEALYEAFKSDADITNKSSMLRIMPYIRRDSPKMGFKPFLEVYLKTRESEPKIKGVPQRIVRELYGRNHRPYSAVRIDKSLAVVTGEKKCHYIYLKEQTRVYFDEARPYYFVKNVATGFWQREDICRQFVFENDISDRLIDREIFKNTCVERYAEYAVDKQYQKSDRIIYGSLLAQIGFLSAEQAAKTDSPVYSHILEGIYRGRIKDGKMSLPELIGITGPQLKYLDGIDVPYEFEKFTECIKDPEFILHFPDVKKRIFAASVFLNKMWRSRYDNRAEKQRILFAGAVTFNSIEKIAGEKRNQLADEYVDYLKMRERYLAYAQNMRPDDSLWQEISAFGEPPANIKPSKIHDQHNKLGHIMGLITGKKTIEEYNRDIIYRKKSEAEDIEYTNGRYSIIMPEDAKDIIREGRILHHCVGHGGYIEAMARRECRILFLRDNQKITEPLITIEERSGRIRQCYGLADSYNKNEEIRDFIKEYAAVRGWEIDAVIYSDTTGAVRNNLMLMTQDEINRLLAGGEV